MPVRRVARSIVRRASLLGAAALSLGVIGAGAAAQEFKPGAPANSGLTQPSGAPAVQIYRGRAENWVPIWLELADLGDGNYVLSVLDGMLNEQGVTQMFVMRSNGRRGSSCRITSVDDLDLSLRGCPNGNAISLDADLVDIDTDVQLYPVSAEAAFGYGSVNLAQLYAEAQQGCTMPALSRAGLFTGAQAPQAIAQLRRELDAMGALAGAADGLESLRTSRMRAILTLRYDQNELQQLAYIDDRMSRIFDYRYRAPYMEQRQQLEAQFANRQDRVAARETLVRVLGQLDQIYNIARSSQFAPRLDAFMQSDLFAAADAAISAEIAASSGRPLADLFAFEQAVASLDQCARMFNPDFVPEGSHLALMTEFALVADDFPNHLNAEIEGGLRSSALQSRLDGYRASERLVSALEASGQEGLLDFAQARISALALAEADAREAERLAQEQAEQRAVAAAAAAERRRLAVSRSGANAPSDGDILNAYVGYLSTITQTTRGAVWLRPVPGSPFELRSHGAMGGELFRVRFDVAGKTCNRVSAGVFDCSFTIRNAFSNARDGSFESGMMALSDGLFSLFSGRDNEGLTGRITANNINRLLLTEETPFTVRFQFTGGQFHSQQLREAVWGNTLVRIP